MRRDYELAHHGIRGQRWGKRNGPPYPLDRSDYSAREKKLAGGTDKSTGSSTEEHKQKGLTKGQKTAIKIGVGLAATALVAAGGYYLYKSGKLDLLMKKGKSWCDNGESSLRRYKNKNTGYQTRTPTQEASLINPKFYSGEEWTQNCTNCSVAYEFRRRGYDVQAAPLATGRSIDEVKKAFVDIPEGSRRVVNDLKVPQAKSYYEFLKESDLSTYTTFEQKYDQYTKEVIEKRGEQVMESLKNEISKFPPGSRGIFNITTGNGGHEMAWEVTKDGTPHLLNPQFEDYLTKAEHSDFIKSWFGGYLNVDETKEIAGIEVPIEFIRTDQLKLSNYGREFLTSVDGKNLPLSDFEKIKIGSAVGAAGTVVGVESYNLLNKKKEKNKK